ncbi:molybdenum cofactor sulfurase 3 [Schistocerca serialis cubense]|uniref:molybdenum cofactor sulfurase 3 n=1 Tax=Schistocerca serialis cubense TaxID=2023355 RepID=UPI00214E4434|nr:molybdenum cofactor sulfurase 3 [Schistocerca serialis cubense]
MYSEETINNLLKDFNRLKDVCYLDHVGATLYSESQIKAVQEDLLSNVYGNPHSLSTCSRYCTDVVDQVRFRVLQHYNANPDEYSVIFTSGATAALKLVAESFVWGEDGQAGTFTYLQDNHTSVLGMRELAASRGASVTCISQEEAFSVFSKTNREIHETEVPSSNSLFVYPAQSNFCGVRYPLSWVESVHRGSLNKLPGIRSTGSSKWFCLLDAAAMPSLDLSHVAPDFVSVSFYKMFGYPTGLGALLVRNSSSAVLRRDYFGGGTVQIALSSERFHVPRVEISERFEDGTLPFLSIVAVRHGLEAAERLVPGGCGGASAARHSLSLARRVFYHLLRLHHANGAPVAVLYGDTDYSSVETQGAVVNFNLLRPTGEFVGFVEVLNMANLHNIQLRTGCFCNPGACQVHLKLSSDDVRKHFQAGHICGDERDLIDGQPTGSVRISFGYMSTEHDVDRFLEMVESAFVRGPAIFETPKWWPEFVTLYRQKFQVDSSCVPNSFDITVPNSTEPLSRSLITIREAGKVEKYSFTSYVTRREKDKVVSSHFREEGNGGVGEEFNLVNGSSWCTDLPEHEREKCSGEMNCEVKKLKSLPLLSDEEPRVLPDTFSDVQDFADRLDSPRGMCGVEDPKQEIVLCPVTCKHLSPLPTTENLTRSCSDTNNNTSEEEANGDSVIFQQKLVASPFRPPRNRVFRGVGSIDANNETEENCCNLTVQPEKPLQTVNGISETVTRLRHIFVYPVKSCGAMAVPTWQVSARGLAYDRQWMVVTSAGVALTQKTESRLCLVVPHVDVDRRILQLHFPGMERLDVSIGATGASCTPRRVSVCQSKVCGDRVRAEDCGDGAAGWLQEALGRPGLRLVRQSADDRRHGKGPADTSELSLSNQAQYLMINLASINWFADILQERAAFPKEGLLERFRSNLVVESTDAFEENEWKTLRIGSVDFKVDGPCTRCQVICVDQATGEKTREPLRTLSEVFCGKMRFGVYLSQLHHDSASAVISVGDRVIVPVP